MQKLKSTQNLRLIIIIRNVWSRPVIGPNKLNGACVVIEAKQVHINSFVNVDTTATTASTGAFILQLPLYI